MDVDKTHKTYNPLLEKLRVPGETFRLPSQGLFYTNGELDPSVKNGEVEVHPMTALDEIVLSTPDKLMSGKAIVEIFSRCIPQVRDPMLLLAKDVDYLMVCLRMVTFGYSMEVSYQHTCEHANPHTYSVDIQEMVRATRSIDPTTINEDYKLTLPNGQLVHLRPLQYGAVLKLYQTTALSKTDGLTEEEAKVIIVDTLASAVRQVDDITDPVLIRDWLVQLRLGWKKEIESAAQKMAEWGVDFTTAHNCRDCGSDIKLTITPNPVSFFS